MSSKTNKIILIAICLISVLLATSLGIFMFIKETQRETLPVLSKIDHFKLTNSRGKEFDSGTLRGKVWVTNLFYTDCSDECDESLKNMAALSRTFEQVSGVKLLSFTINPLVDTSDVLKSYKATLKSGRGNWFFLTGDKMDLQNVLESQLKLGSPLEFKNHVDKLRLVDRSGYVRGVYNGSSTQEINQLFIDVNILLKERF